MTTSFKIDAENQIVFVRRSGRISPGEPIKEMQRIAAESDYKNITKLLSDLSNSDLTAISDEEWSRHAMLCKKIFANLKSIAIVAHEDYSFGISRWFEMSSGLGNTMVFRDMKDALKWLGINSLPGGWE